MMTTLRRLFSRPSPTDVARRALEDHQRNLVDARQHLQRSTAAVRYHESSISELRRTLNELEAH